MKTPIIDYRAAWKERGTKQKPFRLKDWPAYQKAKAFDAILRKMVKKAGGIKVIHFNSGKP